MTPHGPGESSPEGLLAPHQTLRTFFQWLWFEFRAVGLRWRRSIRDWRERSPAAAVVRSREWRATLAESVSPLWTAGSEAENRLVAGKVQNLRVAAGRLDGLVVAAGETFSFWKAVGAPRRRRGFVPGRELREGCMIATVGGGLCQLSNALHLAALEAGMEIVERHAHSKVVPGSIAASGKDATVFWNYVDLRFRAAVPFVMEARLSSTHLIVRFRSEHSLGRQSAESTVPSPALETAEDCVTCHHHGCVYHPGVVAGAERTALLLDECWPEFDAWIAGQSLAESDIALVPLDGVRRQRKAYAWLQNTQTRPAIREHPWLVLQRSWKSRRLRAQGAERQRALLAFDKALARAYASRIPLDCRRLIVSLNLLPHLADSGALGGRHVTVLLNRSPLFLLHQQLDRAAAIYPHSPTIADFRADAALAEREQDALAQADLLVTPHAWLADQLRRLGFQRVELLPWTAAKPQPHTPGRKILFPALGLARKGAHEVRDICRELNLPLAVLGRAQENPGFWQGHDVTFVQKSPDLFRDIACVVLPAHVEHQPRLLLSALASGVPVICSPECGVVTHDLTGLTLVPRGDTHSLLMNIRDKCKST
jgi:VanW like protein